MAKPKPPGDDEGLISRASGSLLLLTGIPSGRRRNQERAASLVVPIALLLLTLALAAKALLSGGDLILSSPNEDLAMHFLPWRDFGFRELRAGNLPLWNPHAFSGLPFLAAFESALLYPPNWLHLILDAGQAVNIGIVLHVFAAGLFTYLWCRHSGFGRLGSGLAGVMYMLSGPYWLRVYAGHLPPLAVMAWIPALFWAVDGWISSRKPGWPLFGMAVVAMQVLAGNPQNAYHACLASACYLALRLPGEQGKSRLALGWAVMFAGGAALSAVQLLPGLDFLGESIRSGGVGYERASSFAFPPENLLTLLSPGFLGDMRSFPYFGRCHLWDTCLFVSVTGLLLAVIGAFDRPERRDRTALIMAGLFLALALGSNIKPLYDLLYHALPGWSSMRGTSKLGILVVLFLCRLAASGFDRLSQGKAKPIALAVISMGTAVLLAVIAAWSWSGPGAGWTWLLRTIETSGECYLAPAGLIADPALAEHSLRSAAIELLQTAGVLASAGVLLWVACRWRDFAIVLAVLTVGELVPFAYGSTALMRPDPSYPAQWTRALDSLARDERVLHLRTPYPNIAMTLGVNDVSGYCQLTLKRYVQLLAGVQGLDPDKVFAFPPIRIVPKLLEVLRLRHVFIGGQESTVPAGARRSPSAGGGGGREPIVRSLPDPMPRLNLVSEWKLVNGPKEALRLMTAPGFDPRRTVLLESEPVPLPDPGPPDAERPAGPRSAEALQGLAERRTSPAGWASFKVLSTDGIEIEAELVRPGILLVTDAYSKNWGARAPRAMPAAQKEYQVLPADLALMAVPLAAGKHRFLLEYSPSAFHAGATISAAAFAGWVAGLGLWIGRKRRPRRKA